MFCAYSYSALLLFFFFFKQKTAYEMRIRDWSSDVWLFRSRLRIASAQAQRDVLAIDRQARQLDVLAEVTRRFITVATRQEQLALAREALKLAEKTVSGARTRVDAAKSPHAELDRASIGRSEEHTSELQSLMRISYAVFCLKKKKHNNIYRKKN